MNQSVPAAPTTQEILKRLIAFDTTSHLPNLDLMNYISGLLHDYGVSSTLIPNEEGTKANLYCTVGPQDKPGVMLSGHTDVVPIDGQDWSSDPFTMREQNDLLYGRGSCDMKGFIACVLSMLSSIDAGKLQTPLHLAFSYDEEIGCIGVRRV